MTNQPSPDQTGMWTPDWNSIDFAANGNEEVQRLFRDRANYSQASRLHDELRTAELRRQQAAQGIVEVRREDVQWLLDYVCDEDHTNWHRPQAQRVDAILTAATEQDS